MLFAAEQSHDGASSTSTSPGQCWQSKGPSPQGRGSGLVKAAIKVCLALRRQIVHSEAEQNDGHLAAFQTSELPKLRRGHERTVSAGHSACLLQRQWGEISTHNTVPQAEPLDEFLDGECFWVAMGLAQISPYRAGARAELHSGHVPAAIACC